VGRVGLSIFLVVIVLFIAIFFGAKKTAAKETAARLPDRLQAGLLPKDEGGQAVEKPRSFVVA